MAARLSFLGVAAFWVLMNLLLWRAEFGARPEFHSPVRLEPVIEKILAAPDPSNLILLRRGQRLGTCQWSSTILRSGTASGSAADRDVTPEEMRRAATGYQLEGEGHFDWPSPTNRLRLHVTLKLTTSRAWTDLRVLAGTRSSSWEIRAHAASRQIELKADEDGQRWERAYTFDELLDPHGAWLRELAGPAAGMLLGALNLPAWSAAAASQPAPAWSAAQDTLPFGGSPLRAYRLETALGERHRLTVHVSRSGEILRVALPGDFTLVNEILETRP